MGFIPGLANDYEAEEADLQTTDHRNTIDRAALDQQFARQDQSAFVRALQAQAAGEGPSLAQMQLDDSLGQLNRQSASAIASTRGLNPAQQARLILQQRAEAAQNAAGQSAQIRAQEQLATQQMLGQQVGNMRGQDQQMFGTAGGLQGQQNQTAVQSRTATNAINADVAKQNTETTQMFVGAGLDAAGKALGAATGGAPAFSGGLVHPSGVTPPVALAGGGKVPFPKAPPIPTFGSPPQEQQPDFATALRLSGMAPAGGAPAMAFAGGGAVPMPGAPVPGDHPANDTVPAMLSPGEIVLPRSVAMDPDAPDEAAAFVEAIKAGESGGTPRSYGELLEIQRGIDAEIAALDEALGRTKKEAK